VLRHQGDELRGCSASDDGGRCATGDGSSARRRSLARRLIGGWFTPSPYSRGAACPAPSPADWSGGAVPGEDDVVRRPCMPAMVPPRSRT
jgi:hypothetical protein